MSKSEDKKEKKAFDQFGKEIKEGDEKKLKNYVNLTVQESEIEEIVRMHHERFEKEELTRAGQFMMALAIVQGAKALLEVTNKEKAKEAMKKAIYDFAYIRGRTAAEKHGNPKDMDSFIKIELEGMKSAPFIPPIKTQELTKTKWVSGMDICPFADSIREIGELFPEYADKDVLEVAASRCVTLDQGRVNGFNPDMKFKHTHFKMGDLVGGTRSEGCYFEFEVEEEPE